MKYFSTNKLSPAVDFREATIKGQAPDRGLYFPQQIPKLPASFFDDAEKMDKEEIAFRVIQPYVGNAIPEDELQTIVAETINFQFPLVKINANVYALELFHGPTLAFKDVGARFMSRCLGHFSKTKSQKVYVIVATSGDTGGAVANGFHGVEGVEVVILYPSGKVSSVQEKQLTTLGANIHSLEVSGSFDDCQKIVKQAFADEALNKKLFLTSANSINVARWLPQQFYYFFAWQQWQHKNEPPVVAVPSGNFGNICAGLVGYRSGLPFKHFIAACNANSAVPEYFANGIYEARPAVATISNAMDVGDPSNFVRLLEIFDHQYGSLKKMVTTYSISDDQTRKTIAGLNKNSGYLADPHGAVAYAAAEQYLASSPGERVIFLETAHPIKFFDVIEPITGQQIPLPESIRKVMEGQKNSTQIAGTYEDLKAYLQGLS